MLSRWVMVLALLLPLAAARAQTPEAFLAPAQDRAFIDAAIAAEAPAGAPSPGVTGITVPHHLLAADLIARGFWAASAGRYRRVIVISPDHYRAVAGRFGTTTAAIATVYGPLAADAGATSALLQQGALFEPVDPYRDHGILALTPFVRHFFPDAQIVPVLAAISTTPQDWQAAMRALAPLMGPETLVVQSTDFSHYLDRGSAALRDGESLAAIGSGDPANLMPLIQPDHMDSRAALAIQMGLQAGIGAAATVIANRNSADYGGSAQTTTSYLVAVWHRRAEATAGLRYADQEVIYLGGDLLLGRFFTDHLLRPKARAAALDEIRSITQGAPLIANLEGVLLDGPLANAPDGSHVMTLDLAGPILADLGVRAVSLANNHSFDFGETGYRATRASLRALGIVALEHGRIADLGTVRLLAINLVPGGREGPLIADRFDPGVLCRLAAPAPVIVLPHWGKEYSNQPTPRDTAVARKMAACAASLIAGSHSHLASRRVALAGPATPVIPSMGNLLFDQSGTDVGSALVEVRLFRQGTIAARLVPLPNLFELAARMREPNSLP